MENLINSLLFIEKLTLLINTLALILIILINKKANAFMVVVPSIIILDLLHQKISGLFGYMLEKQDCTVSILFSGEISCGLFVYHAWYLTFGFTDLLLIIFCITIINMYKLRKDHFSKVILFNYFALAVLQCVRWLDRNIFETDTLHGIYTLLVPMINVSVSIIILTALAFVSYRRLLRI